MIEDIQGALRPARMVNSDHPAVIEFAQRFTQDTANDRERAVRLYYAVRDGFRYDPYKLDTSEEGLSASRVLADGSGWCVPKAALLAAACRVAGVPARVGYADVRNHLSTARLRETMGTDIFYYHGYTVIYLDGNWVKATPAFNIELCEKLGLHPLEFDGGADSIYHPYDLAGNRHMEYVNFRGEYDDIPRDDMLRAFAEYYPYIAKLDANDWDADVTAEAGQG
jgi:transglutaminase-like putative cysteine protease